MSDAVINFMVLICPKCHSTVDEDKCEMVLERGYCPICGKLLFEDNSNPKEKVDFT